MSWQPINLAAPEFDRPSAPPAVCGLFYTGERHTTSGVPESLKTMFSLIIGLEWMRADLGNFALLDFESSPRTIRRILADLGATVDEIAAVYYLDEPGVPTEEDIEGLAAAGVTLATIDAAAGAYDAGRLDDNKRVDAETFGRAWIDPLWRRSIATNVLDHVTKNGETRGKFTIGSERKVGRVDVHLGLEVVTPLSRGKHGLVRILTHKDRPGHLPRPRAAELELVSDSETHRVTWTFKPASAGDEKSSDNWRPTFLMQRVTDYLRTQSEPVSRNSIIAAISGKREYILQAIDFLVLEGTVTETKGPRGAKLIALAPVPGSHQFPEPLGTTEGNDQFPVPSSTRGTGQGTSRGNHWKAAA